MGQGKGAPETGRPFASGPFGERRQAHQDRVDIAAGLETEQSPAVVDEVEFGVAPAPEQLRVALGLGEGQAQRSEEHTSELQSLMSTSYAVFWWNKKKNN